MQLISRWSSSVKKNNKEKPKLKEKYQGILGLLVLHRAFKLFKQRCFSTLFWQSHKSRSNRVQSSVPKLEIQIWFCPFFVCFFFYLSSALLIHNSDRRVDILWNWQKVWFFLNLSGCWLEFYSFPLVCRVRLVQALH